MVTAVLLVQKANLETITQFHDQISNELPTAKGKWNFNFKIFRNNQYSIPQELVDTHEQAPESKFLFTLSPSYLRDSTITLINVGHPSDLSIPNDHLRRGATTGLNDKFDNFISAKLQSLWTQRQLIKGDGGQIYELENGNLCIRTSNVFLHGNFRGLLIQIEMSNSLCDTNNHNSFKEHFNKIVEKYGFPEGNLCCDVLDKKNLDKYGDLCLQYSKILNF
ncbi:TATA-binding related factor (TRF) of subunit 20 of Mediator complex family protein [Candida albicans]|uniref:Mediator of RNA polymerase II transcription subunit 20 n=1 Tax=Candida albicans TaxID=5476 RepID=A0A8H6F2M0_CANAX|nr:TATA-binding related factor (TRF) of subunit 20 of Mediator complex family protein [Candida albicans]